MDDARRRVGELCDPRGSGLVAERAGDLEALGIRFIPFTAEDAGLVEEVRRTARRQHLRLSLADCCCLAVGIRLNLPVIGGDQAWEALRLGVDVHPLR